jgi:hypothetical protein
MDERPDRQRLRPTVEGRARLLAAIEMAGQPHVVDAGTLGEYAEVIAVRGQAHADASFPEVAEHLASGCPGCADDLRELISLAADPDLTPHPQRDLTPRPPLLRGEGGQESRSAGESGRARQATADDSGIYAVDLPDVRAAEAEAARRQRLRRLRDWLLVAAAVAILLIGLSLVGLAYLASGQPGTRLDLTPVPVTTPAAPPSAGRATPQGMACPGSHPIKGNRSTMIYHPPGGEFYEPTRPEDCFASPADAEAAGYRRSQR